MSDDIEVIEDTIPKLEAFKSSSAKISSDVDDLLNRIDRFSVSAISSDGLTNKSKGLQVRANKYGDSVYCYYYCYYCYYCCCYYCLLLQEFSGEIEKERADFEVVLTSCGLLETPFDRSKFENDVTALKDTLNQCEKVGKRTYFQIMLSQCIHNSCVDCMQRVSDKKSEMKALEKKIHPMEDMFAKFRAWLGESKEHLASLTPPPPLSRDQERERILQQAQVCIDRCHMCMPLYTKSWSCQLLNSFSLT